MSRSGFWPLLEKKLRWKNFPRTRAKLGARLCFCPSKIWFPPEADRRADLFSAFWIGVLTFGRQNLIPNRAEEVRFSATRIGGPASLVAGNFLAFQAPRRREDSNLWYPYGYNSFQDYPDQPLRHASAVLRITLFLHYFWSNFYQRRFLRVERTLSKLWEFNRLGEPSNHGIIL